MYNADSSRIYTTDGERYYMGVQGAYTWFPLYVLPLSSNSFVFSFPAISLIQSLHSSSPRHDPEMLQHSEHAREASFTVDSSSSFRRCNAINTSTRRWNPVFQLAIPPSVFMLLSSTRYDGARLRYIRRSSWSIEPLLRVMPARASTTSFPKSVGSDTLRGVCDPSKTSRKVAQE